MEQHIILNVIYNSLERRIEVIFYDTEKNEVFMARLYGWDIANARLVKKFEPVGELFDTIQIFKEHMISKTGEMKDDE